MGLCALLPSSLLTLTTPHLLLSPTLLVGVKRVMSADLCVLLHRPITSPWGGGACTSLTSETLPQHFSDVLRCLLKKLPGDCCQHCRCPIILCVLPPVMMDHSLDAWLQCVILRARRGRRWGWYGWLQGTEGRLWKIYINSTPLWDVSGESHRTKTDTQTCFWSHLFINKYIGFSVRARWFWTREVCLYVCSSTL